MNCIKHLLLLACLLAGATSYAQVIPTRAKDELKGNVKSCTETTYYAKDKFGEIVQGDVKSTVVYEYDAKGFRTKDDKYTYTNTYNSAGKITSTDKLDADGKLVAKDVYTYTASSAVMTNYNSDGDPKEKTTITKGKETSDSKTIYYDTYNRRTKYTFSVGPLSGIATDTYNAKGALATTKVNINDGMKVSTFKFTGYKYDAKGNWIYRISYEDGNVAYIKTREIVYY